MSNINELADLISQELTQYTDEVTEKIKDAIDTVSNEVNEEIKNHIEFNEITGKYVKSFRIKTSFEDKYNKRNTWYVANRQHSKTHLLEFGHAKRNGGRVKAYPHISFGDELAKKRMEELVREAVEK